MRLGPIIIERKTDAQIRYQRQQDINTLRRGGFGKMAAREQRKLDAKGGKKLWDSSVTSLSQQAARAHQTSGISSCTGPPRTAAWPNGAVGSSS